MPGQTVEVKLPDIGEGIAEGEITKWLVREGDRVKKYQSIAEITTVKVSIEFPSPYDGKITRLLAAEGQVVKIGEPLLLMEIEETIDEAKTHMQESRKKHAEALEYPSIRATPAVRKLALELGVDLSSVRGTGPGGRVTEEDVRRASSRLVEDKVGVKRVPIRGLRRAIAERLVASRSRGAHVTVFERVDASALLALREATRSRTGDTKFTFLPFIIKILAVVLREYPMLNGTVDDEGGEILVSEEVNLGIAVDTPDGLLVPVIRNVEKKSILTLAKEIEEASKKAHEGRLTLEDVRGGTFSVSNYGALGGLSGTPIINYPEIAILGIGRVERLPTVEGERIVIRPIMEIALTFDHRVVDGGYVSNFIKALKQHLENPALLLLGV